jgi:hypothetical protein
MSLFVSATKLDLPPGPLQVICREAEEMHSEAEVRKEFYFGRTTYDLFPVQPVSDVVKNSTRCG